MRYRWGELAIREALELSPREFQVFAALCFDADERGYVEFQQSELGERLCCGRQTIGKCLGSLEDNGFLTKTRKYGGRGNADLTAVEICKPIASLLELVKAAGEPEYRLPANATRQAKEKSISPRRRRRTSKPAAKK